MATCRELLNQSSFQILIDHTYVTVEIVCGSHNSRLDKGHFITVEYGPLTINREQLYELCYDVNEQNGKLLVLITERRIQSESEEGLKESKKNTLITLPGIIEDDDTAKTFQNIFIDKTSEEARKSLLKRITSSSEKPWSDQRTPFFYGFYTFQEEYNLEHFKLEGRIKSDPINEKDLLIDLALLTIYSQNAYIPYEEIYKRNGMEYLSISFARLYEQHSSVVKSIIVEKEEGWRLCHPFIAKLVLTDLYNRKSWKECVYDAANHYIECLYKIYGSDSDYANRILRELFIDRTEFSTEKASFSLLITDVEKMSQRKKLFESLIAKYPNNPHYYSHLARLLAYKIANKAVNYNRAIELLNKAIEVAREENLPEIIHYITLGSVYGRKIADDISDARNNYLKGRLAPRTIGAMIDEILPDYQEAESAFKTARRLMKKIDSYYFYPFMSLEFTIIYKLLNYDNRDRSLPQLYEGDKDFRNWYNVHYPRTVSMLEDMQRNAESVDSIYSMYLERAKDRIRGISISGSNWMSNKLQHWARQEGMEACHHRRMIVSAIYTNAGYNWKNIDTNDLQLMAGSMHKNILMSSAINADINDLFRWYAITSYLENFDPYDVVSLFDECKEKDYRIEYVLYKMYFLLLTKGVATSKNVFEHINKCKSLLPAGINDISNRDVFINTGGKTCNPIVPIRNVKERDRIQTANLAEFTGRITAVTETSHGKIEMDDYNISITFNPIFTDDNGKRIEFTVESEQTPVVFNLMFTYSGLRAWNVRKTP